MRTSHFDIDFASQMKLTKFPLIHYFDTVNLYLNWLKDVNQLPIVKLHPIQEAPGDSRHESSLKTVKNKSQSTP